jgi:ribosomal protein L9
LDKRKIEMADPIRNVGDSEVTVSLYAGIKVPMTVKVAAQT